jgi:hypothetical protein
MLSDIFKSALGQASRSPMEDWAEPADQRETRLSHTRGASNGTRVSYESLRAEYEARQFFSERQRESIQAKARIARDARRAEVDAVYRERQRRMIERKRRAT